MALRRPELVPIGGLGVALLVAILLGKKDAPSSEVRDRRLSAALSGPRGAKGLASALEALGVKVAYRHAPLFDVARDTTELPRGAALLLLDPEQNLTAPELAAVTDYVDAGGRVVNVGVSGFEDCVGYGVSSADTSDRFRPVDLRAPKGFHLPQVRSVLTEADSSADSASAASDTASADAGCDLLEADRADTLLTTQAGGVVALDLRFDGGGRVTLISDPALIANRGLKETDAGLVVLPWLLNERPSLVVFDEYHQGFGEDGSLVAATLGWALRSPFGWVMLQLAVVALIALAAAAVRFGPALKAVERRRRSPIEHVTALAAGLERAEGRDTAIRLLARGLKRRLSRGAAAGRSLQQPGDLAQWLRSLELATRSPEAQLAVRRFANLTLQRGGDQQVLAAATAVEDVWQALGPKDPRTRS
ncbi:MAG TPA: DUF4350 domain-containing protein [Gemmatimonadales bacterium]